MLERHCNILYNVSCKADNLACSLWPMVLLALDFMLRIFLRGLPSLSSCQINVNFNLHYLYSVIPKICPKIESY